jgi:hypothetical protein
MMIRMTCPLLRGSLKLTFASEDASDFPKRHDRLDYLPQKEYNHTSTGANNLAVNLKGPKFRFGSCGDGGAAVRVE